MATFSAPIHKFNQKGEKTGWTFIDIPIDITQQLNPDNKKSFRVKGTLDNYEIKQVALVPMGDGAYLLALNGDMRKSIGKRNGDTLQVNIVLDNSPIGISPDLLEALEMDKAAAEYFNSLPMSHRHYFSKWIESAKSISTKANRIVQTIHAAHHQMNYAEMIRFNRDNKMK